MSETVRNLSKVSAGDLVSKAIGVGIVLLLIRKLSVQDYAFYVAFESVANISASLIGSGINNALVRYSTEYISKSEQRPYVIYRSGLLFQIAAFLVLTVFSLIFPNQAANLYLGNAKLASTIVLGLFYGLGILMFGVGRAIYQAEERFSYYIRALMFRQVSVLLVLIGLWIANRLSFVEVTWALLGIQFVVGIIVLAQALSGMRWNEFHIDELFRNNILRDFIPAMGWLTAYFTVLASFSQIDVMMLSRFASSEELAGYGVAFRYYSLALLTLASIHSVLAPKFARAEMQDTFPQRRFMARWIRVSVWLGIPILMFDMLGEPFYIWLNGVRYANSFKILLVFSIGVWLSFVFSPLVNILISRKEFQFLFTISILGFAVSLVGNYYLVHLLGGLGAAIAVVVSIGVINICSAIRVNWSGNASRN